MMMMMIMMMMMTSATSSYNISMFSTFSVSKYIQLYSPSQHGSITVMNRKKTNKYK